MKRSFKVATAFTGVAACATVMAPAAGAATTMRDTAMNCTANTAPWVHLYYSPNQHHPTPACFGNNGANFITHGQKFSELCTGNNFGFFVISGATSPFGSGERLSGPPLRFTEVFISGHTKNFNQTCPL